MHNVSASPPTEQNYLDYGLTCAPAREFSKRREPRPAHRESENEQDFAALSGVRRCALHIEKRP